MKILKRLYIKAILKISDYFLNLQEKKHKKRMEEFKKGILSAKTGGKSHITSCATLSIQEKEKQKTLLAQEKIKKIVTTFLSKKNGVEKLFEYIKNANTPVYKLNFANKILSLINEQEGLIFPKKGFSALYLNLILNKKISFKTSEMFVLRNFNVNIYAIIYQFYHWYCYKMKISGYESETQEKFKHIFEIYENNRIDILSFSDVVNLKCAIKRDVEAIDFVLNLIKVNDMSKKNLQKIKEGKAVNL